MTIDVGDLNVKAKQAQKFLFLSPSFFLLPKRSISELTSIPKSISSESSQENLQITIFLLTAFLLRLSSEKKITIGLMTAFIPTLQAQNLSAEFMRMHSKR
jgi:hypothetical protein